VVDDSQGDVGRVRVYGKVTSLHNSAMIDANRQTHKNPQSRGS
jgi:hypothetical protein